MGTRIKLNQIKGPVHTHFASVPEAVGEFQSLDSRLNYMEAMDRASLRNTIDKLRMALADTSFKSHTLHSALRNGMAGMFVDVFSDASGLDPSGLQPLNGVILGNKIVKLDLAGGTGGTSGQKVYTAPNGITVTSSAPVYSNSNYYYMEYLFNGTITQQDKSPTTYWLTNSSGNQTLTFDLLIPYRVAQINVAPRTRDDASSNYRIFLAGEDQVYTEVVPWVQVHHSGTGQTPYETINTHIIDAEARYIRFELTRNGSWGVTLSEIEIYVQLNTGESNHVISTPEIIPIYPRRLLVLADDAYDQEPIQYAYELMPIANTNWSTVLNGDQIQKPSELPNDACLGAQAQITFTSEHLLIAPSLASLSLVGLDAAGSVVFSRQLEAAEDWAAHGVLSKSLHVNEDGRIQLLGEVSSGALDLASGYVDVAGVAGTPITNPDLSGALTIECWAYIRGGYYIIGTGAQSSYRGFVFSYQDGSPFVTLKTGNKTWNVQIPQGEVPLNQWFHWAFVWDGEILRVLRNDQEIASGYGTTGGASSGLDILAFGRPANTTSSPGNVILKDVRIWATARQDSEIFNNMFRLLRGTEDGLIGYWRLDDGEGDIARDITPHGRHGQIKNVINWTQSDIELIGGSVSGTYTLNPIIVPPQSELDRVLISWTSEEPAGTSITTEARINAYGPFEWQPITPGEIVEITKPHSTYNSASLRLRAQLGDNNSLSAWAALWE